MDADWLRVKRIPILIITVGIGVSTFTVVAQAAPPPLPQAPMCEVWKPPYYFELYQDNGILVATYAEGDRIGGIASHTVPGKSDVKGSAVGSIRGRALDFTINWDDGYSNHYTGQINDDGTMSGTTTNNRGVTNTWSNLHPSRPDLNMQGFSCAPPPVNPNPPPQPPPPSKPGPEVSYDELLSIVGILKVSVRDLSGEASECTYLAKDTSGRLNDSFKQFALSANGNTSFEFNAAFRTGSTWDVVVDCGGTKVTRLQKIY